MSIEFDEFRRLDPRVWFAYRVLSHEIPEMLDKSKSFVKRLAKAYSWYIYLCSVSTCPQNVAEDMNEWSESDIMEIAKTLAKHFASLIDQITKELL